MSNNAPFYYNHPPNPTGVTPPMMAASVAARGMSPAQMGMPYMQQAQFRNVGPDPAAMHRKRVQNKTSRQGAGMIEDGDEPSGDELDDISARDIAMARYKRNHDYLSEIFTPYNASSITLPPIEVQQSKAELTKMIEEEQKAIEARTKEHEQLLESIERKREGYWKTMANLDSASTIEDMSKSAEQFEQVVGIKVEHSASNVHATQIPGLEYDQPSTSAANNGREITTSGQLSSSAAARNGGTQTGQSNMGMFQSYPTQEGASASNNDAGQNDEDNSNDFFNEMVNTGQEEDDGGSVSEFLNTADMDFEQTDKTDVDQGTISTDESQKRS